MITVLDTSFGDRLRELRTNFDLSQDKLADTLGITQLTLSNYETGKRFPDIRIIQKLRELFNVNLNWLINGHGSIFEIPLSNDPNMQELIKCAAENNFIRFRLFSTFEEIKLKYPHLFKKSENQDI